MNLCLFFLPEHLQIRNLEALQGTPVERISAMHSISTDAARQQTVPSVVVGCMFVLSVSALIQFRIMRTID